MTTSVFAISDLHLSFARPKPMAKFGPHWENHADRIAHAWRKAVGPDDVVLIPGDISWATRLGEAVPDLHWVGALPGRKILVRGNHDYWWNGINKVRKAAPDGMYFVQNDAVCLDGVAVGGARMWDFPGVSWPIIQTMPEREALPADLLQEEATDGRGQAKILSPEHLERIRNRELLRLARAWHNCLLMLP